MAAGEDWRLVVRSLKHVMNYTSVIGGRTALEAQGFERWPGSFEQILVGDKQTIARFENSGGGAASMNAIGFPA